MAGYEDLRAIADNDLGPRRLDHDLLALKRGVAPELEVVGAHVAREEEVDGARLVRGVEALDFGVDDDDRLGCRVEHVL